jgi:hypothetical protein
MDEIWPVLGDAVRTLCAARMPAPARVVVGPEGAVVLAGCDALRINCDDPRNLPRLEALTTDGWVHLCSGQRDALQAELLDLAGHMGDPELLVTVGD